MFHFIPAWYQTDRPWYDATTPWYRGVSPFTLDDTINQLQMFQKVEEQTSLVLLNYMPNLRYFLHRYDLFEVPVWSVFDQIQQIENVETTLLDFKAFAWPKGVEFIYTPFLVAVRKNNEPFAYIEFGEAAHLIHITFLEEGVSSKRLIFDDRGFLSSILYYDKDGREAYQDYLNLVGEWQIRETISSQKITVNPNARHRFKEAEYASMEALIAEKVEEYVSSIPSTDILITASHPQHNSLILAAKQRKKVILSYFGNRYPLGDLAAVQQDLKQADLVLTDTRKTQEKLLPHASSSVEHLSLFDARLSLGKSQRFRELFVYLLIDPLSEESLLQVLEIFFHAMTENEHIHLKLISYKTDVAQQDEKKAWLASLLEGFESLFFDFVEEEEADDFEEEEEDEERIEKRVSLEFLYSDLAIMESLETSRIIVDVSDDPDLYTQIAGISTGIPQINRVETEFIEHLKNGYILSDIKDLPDALDYYLTGLSHWNESVMYAAQKIVAYTSGSLVEKIKNSVAYE
ncbi:accessory Sec system protein Asp1 [Streptococcus pneumoniae]